MKEEIPKLQIVTILRKVLEGQVSGRALLVFAIIRGIDLKISWEEDSAHFACNSSHRTENVAIFPRSFLTRRQLSLDSCIHTWMSLSHTLTGRCAKVFACCAAKQVHAKKV